MSARRVHHLDWLRAIAVAGVVMYHALLPFSTGLFIGNAERSAVLTGIVASLAAFGLPILFLVAGASARFAIQTRSTRVFLTERASRLLLPFLVGTLVLGPPMGYLIGIHNGTWSGPFPAYLVAWPGIVFGYTLQAGLSPALFQVGAHLWFLVWLFLFSALGSPVFALLSSTRGRSFSDMLARLVRWPGATLLFAVPVGVPVLALYVYAYPGLWDWWAFGWFGVTFVVGYLIYSDERLLAAARRDFLPALFVAVLGSAALLAVGFVEWQSAPHRYGATYFLMLGLYGITSWAWTLTLLGIGMRTGFMQRPLHPRAREAVLPFYVLHMPIAITIAFFVVQWPLGLWPKVLINVGLVIAATLLAVAAALRVPILRPLLGVRRTTQRRAGRTRSLSRATDS